MEDKSCFVCIKEWWTWGSEGQCGRYGGGFVQRRKKEEIWS